MMRVIWTDEMLGTLRAMRDDGHSMQACANRIGVSYEVLHRKAKQLDLTGRMHVGPISGVRCRAEGRTTSPAG